MSMLQKSPLKIKYDFEKESTDIEKYVEPLNYNHSCPFCGSRDVVRNGKYSRNIVYLKNKRILVKSITLQRFLCKKCHKTRTFYPSFVIPRREYSRYLISYILLSPEGIKSLRRSLLVPVNQVRRIRKVYHDLAVKFVHLADPRQLIRLSELLELYEYTFISKAFYPYQRDMALIYSP